MDNKSNYKYLLSDLSSLKGVGPKTAILLKKKGINNLFDLLWKLPKYFTDRTTSIKVKDLESEIYLIELYVQMKLAKWIVFFLIVTKDMLKRYYPSVNT